MGFFTFKRNNKHPDDFWREYEEKTGEKIIARGLGQYVSGWDEFGNCERNPLWGLIIASSGGFRFHHFPNVNWMTLIGSDGAAPKEKIIFIPREKIISASLSKETKWYIKLFSPSSPRLLIRYLAPQPSPQGVEPEVRGSPLDEKGTEKDLLFNAEYKLEGIAEVLK